MSKQTLTPRGIMYTPTSGIWQTVWIEPSAAQPSPPVDRSMVPMMMPWVSLRRPRPWYSPTVLR